MEVTVFAMEVAVGLCSFTYCPFSFDFDFLFFCWMLRQS